MGRVKAASLPRVEEGAGGGGGGFGREAASELSEQKRLWL